MKLLILLLSLASLTGCSTVNWSVTTVVTPDGKQITGNIGGTFGGWEVNTDLKILKAMYKRLGAEIEALEKSIAERRARLAILEIEILTLESTEGAGI